MIIHVDSQYGITIQDPKDFKKFKVIVAAPIQSLGNIKAAVSKVVTFDDAKSGWVSAGALFDWPSLKDDPDWRGGLEAMIEKARPHGWIKDAPLSIKAHIEWADAAA